MGNHKKKIIVLDVEGMSGKRPYDIGYIVADLKGNIFIERSFACMPAIMENLSGAIRTAEKYVRDMTHKNISEILQTPSKYKWSMDNDIKQTLVNDIIENKVSEIWAYNCNFDKSMITKLCGDLGVNVIWLDIWSAIVMTKCLTKKYVKFCRENGFITEKGNCKTSAEVVYRYLFDEVGFEEEHTGLSDTKIEYKILLTAKKTKKKIDGTLKQPWKIVKKFCESNDL